MRFSMNTIYCGRGVRLREEDFTNEVLYEYNLLW